MVMLIIGLAFIFRKCFILLLHKTVLFYYKHRVNAKYMIQDMLIGLQNCRDEPNKPDDEPEPNSNSLLPGRKCYKFFDIVCP